MTVARAKGSTPARRARRVAGRAAPLVHLSKSSANEKLTAKASRTSSTQHDTHCDAQSSEQTQLQAPGAKWGEGITLKFVTRPASEPGGSQPNTPEIGGFEIVSTEEHTPISSQSSSSYEQTHSDGESKRIGTELQLDTALKQLAELKLQQEELLTWQESAVAPCFLRPCTQTPSSPSVAGAVAQRPGGGTLDWAFMSPFQTVERLDGSIDEEIAALESMQPTPGHNDAGGVCLKEVQELVLEHISNLTMCVSEAIEDWNVAQQSPAGKIATSNILDMKQQAVRLSSDFQRKLGASTAGWQNPIETLLHPDHDPKIQEQSSLRSFSQAAMVPRGCTTSPFAQEQAKLYFDGDSGSAGAESADGSDFAADAVLSDELDAHAFDTASQIVSPSTVAPLSMRNSTGAIAVSSATLMMSPSAHSGSTATSQHEIADNSTGFSGTNPTAQLRCMHGDSRLESRREGRGFSPTTTAPSFDFVSSMMSHSSVSVDSDGTDTNGTSRHEGMPGVRGEQSSTLNATLESCASSATHDLGEHRTFNLQVQNGVRTTSLSHSHTRYTEMRRALLQAHEDFVRSALAEKQIMERLTAEMVAVKMVAQNCIQRERLKEEQWVAWVLGLHGLACNTRHGAQSEETHASRNMDTSTMMRTVEDCVAAAGSHAHRQQIDLIEQKRYLMRVVSTYEYTQLKAQTQMGIMGISPASMDHARCTIARPLSGCRRFKAAVFAVIATHKLGATLKE